MTDWKEISLYDAGVKLYDCVHKTPPEADEGYPYIAIPQIHAGRIDYARARKISPEHFVEWTRKLKLKENDVVLSRRCNPGVTAFVDGSHECALGQNLVVLRSETDKVFPPFLRWMCRSRDWWEQVAAFINVGATFDSLKCADIPNFVLPIPPAAEQRVIAAILSSLDDKIDLLHRQNKTHEAMAETLFRQWFVEESSDDWDEVCISDVATLNASVMTNSHPHKSIRYLDTGSLTDGNFGDIQYLSVADAPSRARRLVKHNDILISTVRPDQRHYGIVKSPKENLVVSTGFCVITAKLVDPHFLYLLLTTEEMTEYLHTIAEGSTSTYPSLKPSDIGKIRFKNPPFAIHKQFTRIASSVWDKMSMNSDQIRSLEKLRDTLLPKLMSGEVRVAYE